MIEACTQLQATLTRVERQFHHLTDLFDVLEKDAMLICSAAPSVSGGTLQPTLELFRGTLQQQTAVLLDHQTRLELLMAELKSDAGNTGVVNGLLLSFSRLFAGVQDAGWIDQQDHPERFTERLVDGYLPRSVGRYLVGEGQWMLGKFTADVDAWRSMKARLEGHRRWTTELFNGVPPGHALAQPLLLTLQCVETMLTWTAEQVHLKYALQELQRIGVTMVGAPGANRVFPMEQMRLEGLVVPFPSLTGVNEE